MEMIKCRTCLKLSKKDDCVDIEERCYLEQSVKQAMLHLVPEMVLTLNDGDMVCRKCLRTLKICVKFIKTCLTVETILAHNRKLFDSPLEGINMEEFKVEIEEIGDVLIPIDFDHNYYMKPEITDSISISSDDGKGENKEDLDFKETSLDILMDENEIKKESLSLLQTTFMEPPLYIQSNLEENIILEISNSVDPVDLETAVDKTELESINKSKYNFTCSICSMKFSEGQKFEFHMRDHVVLCQFCGKTLPDETAYENHVVQHSEHTLKVCEFCGKILKGARSLKMHIATMHEEPSPHICDRCPKSFKHKYKVNLHVKEVHEKARQQQCSACGKLFVNSERCKSHYRLVHLKLKPYVCTICGKKYGRKDYLDKHKVEHGGLRKNGQPKPSKVPKHGIRLKNPGKPVICRVCGKEIASVHLLKAHLENHVKIKRYKCKYCELTFSVPNNKKRHEKLHENDTENKFRCNICWKRMKTEEELEIHIKGHDRPPQYACDTCGDKFHRRYLLKNHIAEKHTSMEDIEKAVEEIVVKNLLEYADPKSK